MVLNPEKSSGDCHGKLRTLQAAHPRKAHDKRVSSHRLLRFRCIMRIPPRAAGNATVCRADLLPWLKRMRSLERSQLVKDVSQKFFRVQYHSFVKPP